MKRTTETKKGSIQWIKVGGGSFTATIAGRKKIIKPGEKFFATLEEIPPQFRDVCKALEPLPEKGEVKPLEVVKPTYTLTHKGGGKYAVISDAGKQMNDTLLPKAEAEALIKELTA